MFTLLTLFWIHAFTHPSFILQLSKSEIAFYTIGCISYIIISDNLIRAKRYESMIRLKNFLLFMLNFIASRAALFKYDFTDQDLFFIVTTSLPILVYGLHIARNFVKWETNATDEVIKEIEATTFVNRLYYGIILLIVGLLSYLIHALLEFVI